MATKFHRGNFMVSTILIFLIIASIIIYIINSVEWNNLEEKDPGFFGDEKAYQYATKAMIGYQSAVMGVLLLLCYFHGINLF